MAGPLAGVRVLELPAIGPVPFLGMLLADLGAQVTRIDRVTRPEDPLSALPIGTDGPLGRGRRSVAIDLRQPAGAEIALELAAASDLLIEGFRPGVAERLGIGPEPALRRNPALVYGRMTGWGQTGPLAPRAGHDITYLAVSGLLHDIGPQDGPPIPPANYLADFGGGAMFLAMGLLAALLGARSSGRGQVVDAAMLDGAAYLATMVRTLHGHRLWQDGPLARTAGHDITYLAVSGLLHGIGPAAGPPMPPANYVCDFGGGAMSLAVGLLAAVLSARSTGAGQVVDASMVDGAAYLATMVRTLHGHGQWRDERAANIFNGGFPNYRCYACSDGGYVAVGALEPKFWNTLLDILGLDPASTPSPMDPGRADELAALLAGVFAGRPRDEWAELFAGTDACVAPVLTLAEAPHYPHHQARQAYAEVAGVSVAAPVPRFSATPATLPGPPPATGADTGQVLAELGYSDDRLAELRAAGVVG
jgi:crotonobetainyl-CoA:carnitine CoA-transferase CaiB-like acyl-CoA transferase